MLLRHFKEERGSCAAAHELSCDYCQRPGRICSHLSRLEAILQGPGQAEVSRVIKHDMQCSSGLSAVYSRSPLGADVSLFAFTSIALCVQDPARQGCAPANSQHHISESTTELRVGMPSQGNLQPLAKRVRTTNYGNPLAVWKTAMDIAAEPSQPIPQGSAAPWQLAKQCVVQDGRSILSMSQQEAALPQEQPESAGQARPLGCHIKATAATWTDTASQPLRQPLLGASCRAYRNMSSTLAGNILGCCWVLRLSKPISVDACRLTAAVALLPGSLSLASNNGCHASGQPILVFTFFSTKCAQILSMVD